MARQAPHLPKVICRFDNPVSENLLPEAVNDYPCGEGIVLASHMLSPFKSPASLARYGSAAESIQKPSWIEFRAQIFMATSNVNRFLVGASISKTSRE